MRYLLGVNVLVALAFTDHPSHETAQNWFHKETGRQWATCPLTQAGFLRVAWVRLGRTNAAVGIALAGLERDCLSPDHEYWPADIDLFDLSQSQRSRLIGRNQIADMQLLMLAHSRGGMLVTFDSGIRELASETGYAHSLLVL